MDIVTETVSVPAFLNQSSGLWNWSQGGGTNSTAVTPTDDPWTELYYKVLWQYVTPIAFILITVVGTTGNGLVAYVILSHKPMQSTTNLMLLNLAFADISLLLICVPFTAYKYAADRWPFGDPFCKVMKYFGYVAVYVNIWTLVSISVLRFMTILFSQVTANIRTKRNVILLNLFIWVIMLTVNIPILLKAKVKKILDYSYCGFERETIKPLFWTFFVFAYVLPLTLITILYLMIIIYLKRHTSGNMADRGHGKERTARACKMIVLVVVVFMLALLPSHVQTMVVFYHQLPKNYVFFTFQILIECTQFLNSCANPIIYNFGSQEFRNRFRHIICCEKIAYWKMRRANKATNTMEVTENGRTLGGGKTDTAYFV